MTPLHDGRDFYKKMLELQERLRKSKEERLKLENRFNLLAQESRSRHESCMNKLRMRYIEFLEEQRARDQRNHQLLGVLDKLDGSLARMTAKTDRLGVLRKQYEAYLLRVYSNKGGGTAVDSGVGSQNDDGSLTNNLRITSDPKSMQYNIVTRNTNNIPNVSQLSDLQAHIGGVSCSAQFNVPGKVLNNVLQTQHSQGDSTMPHRIPADSHYASSGYPRSQFAPSLILQDSGQSDPNIQQLRYIPIPPRISQEDVQSYHPNIAQRTTSRRSSHVPQEYARLYDQNLPQRFPAAARATFVQDPQSINVPGLVTYNGPQQCICSQSFEHSTLPAHTQNVCASPMSSPATGTVVTVPDTKATITDDNYSNLYGRSTPLPGYLDYSTRYSRDLPRNDTNDSTHPSGFTRTDLENLIKRNERILPRDYLHNSETFSTIQKEAVVPQSSDSTLTKDKKLISPIPELKTTKALENELDRYINKIRNLHRDPDIYSLEDADIEQNTSGDLLNVTLSEDDLGQPTERAKDSDVIGPLLENVKGVLALADDLVSGTADVRVAQEMLNLELPANGDRIIPASETRQTVGNDIPKILKAVPESTCQERLMSDVENKNVHDPETRDDIRSVSASDVVLQNQNMSAWVAGDKIRSHVAPPIAKLDASYQSIKDVAKLVQNNLGSNELTTNKQHITQNSQDLQEYFEVPPKRSAAEERIPGGNHDGTGSSISKGQDGIPGETHNLEDIEGNHTDLVGEEELIEEHVVDAIRELKPQDLRHCEEKMQEIHIDDEEIKTEVKKGPLPNAAKSKINEPVVLSNDTEKRKESVNETVEEVSFAEHAKQEMQPLDEREKDTGIEGVYNRECAGSTLDPNRKITEDNVVNQQYQNDSVLDDGLDLIKQSRDYENYPNQHDEEQIGKNGNTEGFENEPGGHEDEADQRYEYDSREQEHDHLPMERKITGDNVFNQQYQNDLALKHGLDPIHQSQDYEHYPNQQDEEGIEKYGNTEGYEYEPGIQEDEVNQRYEYGSREQEHESNRGYDPRNQVNDPNQQYQRNSNQSFEDENTGQYEHNLDQQISHDLNLQGDGDQNWPYEYDAREGYQRDPNESYEQNPNHPYGYDPNRQYEHNPNDLKEQYDPHYSNEHNPNDSEEQYDPHYSNEQYEHDPNQQYENDPNQQFEHNEHYEYDSNQQYQENSQEQFEHNSAKEMDPNQPNDLNQQYYHDTDGQNYSDDQHYEVDQNQQPYIYPDGQSYESPNQDSNARQEAQPYQIQGAAEEVIERKQSIEIDDEGLANLRNEYQIGEEVSNEGEKKKKKDVITALLESDTESTLERNLTNNTESDFDFN